MIIKNFKYFIMEKYVKFDDPSNGLNAFTPLDLPKKRTGVYLWLRSIFGVFLIVLRIPMFILAIFVCFTLHAVKYLLVLPPLIRMFERFNDRMCSKLIMSISSFSGIRERYNREHKEYDFVKQ